MKCVNFTEKRNSRELMDQLNYVPITIQLLLLNLDDGIVRKKWTIVWEWCNSNTLLFLWRISLIPKRRIKIKKMNDSTRCIHRFNKLTTSCLTNSYALKQQILQRKSIVVLSSWAIILLTFRPDFWWCIKCVTV